MREVKAQDVAKRLGVPVGTTLYLVEYSDGSSTEIPGNLLRRDTAPSEHPGDSKE